MPAQLLLDFDAAVELHVTMTTVADDLDHDRRMLAGPVADAADLIGSRGIDPDPHLRAVAELLRREADDLARRVRMIAFGGPEINAGLAALDVIAANWDTIDNKGRPDGNDGIISRSDLEWAIDNLDPTIAQAARWLLDHDDFFTAVETAKHNTNYLADGGAGFASGGDGDGKLSRDDLTSYMSKLDTWATLVPYMSTIDIAAHGGTADGVMSRNDFEAFLDDQTLPPQVRQAAQQVLDDSAYHDTGGIGWDDVLMVASFIPIVGDFIDGAMALYYLSQGDWEQAALSGLGLLPIPGLTGASVRGAKAAAEELSEEFLEEGLETLAQRTARENLDDAGGAARRTDHDDMGQVAEAEAPPPPGSGVPEWDEIPAMSAAPSPGVPRKTPDAEDLAQVPAMSGARHTNATGGGSPSGGTGGGSAPEPPPSGGRGGPQPGPGSADGTASSSTPSSPQRRTTSEGATNAASGPQLAEDLATAELANPLMASLRATGELPPNYVTKAEAAANGWAPGKALNNAVPGGQVGGDVFRDPGSIGLPTSAGRTWFEADIGLVGTMGRNKQPGTRLLFSSDGLAYVTPDHYQRLYPLPNWSS